MKKLIFGLVLMFFLLAFGNAHAQGWTWSDPALVTSTHLKEIAANPITGETYGIQDDGALVTPIVTGTTVSDPTGTPDGSELVYSDIAIASTGAVFISTEIDIRQKQGSVFEPLVGQPSPPEEEYPVDSGTFVQGKYTHIAVGQGGKLYVLYEINETGNQYLMIGTPPVISEGVVVNIHPETLNLGSKGRWVTGIIDLPGEADESAITPGAVKISYITISDHGAVIAEDSADIPVAPGAPWSVELLDGKQVLKVKFPRYDKADPGNPQSLIGKLKDLLTTANAAAGRYQVTLTVDIPTSSGQFSGTDTIRIMLKHKMH